MKVKILALVAALVVPAQAQTWTGSILNLPQPSGCDVWPLSGLTIDSQGSLYFTAYNGINSILYKVTADNVIHAFYTFPSGERANGMVTAAAGNLYGTAQLGSTSVIYRVTSTGEYADLYNFPTNAKATGSLRLDSLGNLYGYFHTNTSDGIFQLSARGGLARLYTFPRGNVPQDSLIINSVGNVYGTASGGTLGYGFIFEVTPTFRYSVLYNFTGGNDGGYPTGKLTQNASGLMYGTTEFGGDLTDTPCLADSQGGFAGCGTVFSITNTGTFSTVYRFTGAADGFEPFGSLSLDPAGNIYGITLNQGNSSYETSTTFQVTPSGVETTIGGANGANPGLAINRAGSVFGSTTGNCDIGGNEIYELSKN